MFTRSRDFLTKINELSEKPRPQNIIAWLRSFLFSFLLDFFIDSGVWRSSGVGSFDLLGGAECLSDTHLDCIDLFVAAKMCLAHTSRTGGTCH